MRQFGSSTRVVDRLLDGTLLEDHARGELIDHTLNLIVQNPLAGSGCPTSVLSWHGGWECL